MAYTITGKVLDSDKQVVPFVLVYTSDANGKPTTPSKNTQTDDKGNWKLDNVSDSDFITIRGLGYKLKTFPAKSIPAIPIPLTGAVVRVVQTTLQNDDSTNLAEVVIEDKKVVKEPKRVNYGLYILIGGLLLLATGVTLKYVGKNKLKNI